MTEQVLELTDDQLERAWQLTLALTQNEAAAKRSLDVLYITACRFVARLDEGLAGDGVELDSGRAGPQGKLFYKVRRRRS